MVAVSPDQFAAELLASAVKAPVDTARVVKRGAQNVKSQAQANVLASAPTHNAGAHRTITYDEPTPIGARIESEIGYDRDAGRAAALGNLLEYGGGGDHSPPHMDLNRAADAEEPRLVDGVQQMVRRLL